MSAAGSYAKYLVWALVIIMSLYLLAELLGGTASLCLNPIEQFMGLIDTVLGWIMGLIDLVP